MPFLVCFKIANSILNKNICGKRYLVLTEYMESQNKQQNTSFILTHLILNARRLIFYIHKPVWTQCLSYIYTSIIQFCTQRLNISSAYRYIILLLVHPLSTRRDYFGINWHCFTPSGMCMLLILQLCCVGAVLMHRLRVLAQYSPLYWICKLDSSFITSQAYSHNDYNASEKWLSSLQSVFWSNSMSICGV